MNIVQKAIASIDRWQRSHKSSAFAFGVVKKYGDDQAGYQAALITYYGFLSLFPLLLVLTTVAGIVGGRNPELGRQLISSVGDYFPVFGNVLETSVNGTKNQGIALVFGVLFALYGARGGADAFRNAVNHIWHVPLAKRSGFPRSLLRSFGLILVTAVGFIGASAISTAAALVSEGIGTRLLSIVINLIVLSVTFVLILRLSLPLSVPVQKFRVGAIVSAVGLTTLVQLGGIVLTQSSKTLSSSGAIFATTLGLLAYIYLLSQVIMYAVEIDTVRDRKLYPRALDANNSPTKIDKQIERERSKHTY